MLHRKTLSNLAWVKVGLALTFSMLIPLNSAKSSAQTPSQNNAAVHPSFADVADQATRASIIIVARVSTEKTLAKDVAGPVAKGFARILYTADVVSLIRGDANVAPRIRYLSDVPVDGRGKTRRLRKTSVILFANATNRPDYVQLLSRDSQMPANAETELMARTLAAELAKPDSPPRIVGIGDVFHTAGTIAGDGETQIFLRTETGAPVSLSVVRHAGQVPQWGVALGEVVDESAVPPVRDTLLWYRLACSLPAQLPAASTRTLPLLDAEAARQDYQFIRQGLGTCDRSL